MGVAIPAVATETIPLWHTLWDADTGDAITDKYVRAYIYERDGSATPLDTVDLVHQAGGVYWGEWSVPAASKYWVTYVAFDDAGYSVESLGIPGDSDLVVSDASGQPAPVLKGDHINVGRF